MMAGRMRTSPKGRKTGASMRIRLNRDWSRFAYLREDMQLLGTVQTGLQIGALALLPSGAYVQVNGDVVQPLNSSRVAHALRSVDGHKMHESQVAATCTRAPAAAPIVIIKKRRRVVSVES